MTESPKLIYAVPPKGSELKERGWEFPEYLAAGWTGIASVIAIVATTIGIVGVTAPHTDGSLGVALLAMLLLPVGFIEFLISLFCVLLASRIRIWWRIAFMLPSIITMLWGIAVDYHFS